ncbi:GNAT family N-acetyltransferase [Saccharibacillus deserti]|uniref:GNAT family N-acetyltransferase n=1 Tax=Saccharibacillus deserti TaxID=1634444 RepID=UPI001555467B|nr:GNAT family N-acetyltransferase [Saccharibacillus deserti]
MRIDFRTFTVKNTVYAIRSAKEADAVQLPDLRSRIDGETEHMDRESGEAPIDESGFAALIEADTASPVNLFAVAEIEGKLVGYARCEGRPLKRFAHRAELGLGVLRDYWGLGIGSALLESLLEHAGAVGLTKLTLSVVETNVSAIRLYGKYGFEKEGVLQRDRIHADGRFYATVLMGRFRG